MTILLNTLNIIFMVLVFVSNDNSFKKSSRKSIKMFKLL